MLYAIPNDGHQITNHFMKAPYIAIYNQQGMVKNIKNPACGGGCQSKSQLLNTLVAQGIDAVITRNIGERSLAKLLKQQVRVFRAAKRADLEQIFHVDRTELTSSSQGKASINNRNKATCGGGCCGDKKPRQIMSSITKPSAFLRVTTAKLITK